MSYNWPGTAQEQRIAELIVAKSGGHFVSVSRKASETDPGELLLGVSVRQHTIVIRDLLDILKAEVSEGQEKLRETLAWYGEQARLARLVHSEGDKGRWALAEDGGKRAKEALSVKIIDNRESAEPPICSTTSAVEDASLSEKQED